MHYTPSIYVEGSYSASDFRGAYTNEVYSHDYLTVLDSYSGSSYSGSSVSTYTRRYIASSHSYTASSYTASEATQVTRALYYKVGDNYYKYNDAAGTSTVCYIGYSPSSYTKESHSYSASQFREPTVAELNAGNYVTILSGYTASSYTKESLSTRAMKYVPSQYTAPTYVGSEFRLARVSEINTLDYVSVVNSYTQSSYSEETETKTFLVS